MGLTDPGVLEARVRRLDGEALAALVADLWAARGFETERDGPVVRVRRSEETQVLYVLGDRGLDDAAETTAVDVVVAPGRQRAGERLAADLGARRLDAADLAEMLRYAVERPVAADLCETHLGAAPANLTLPVGDRARRAVSRLGVRAAVVAIALLLVVGVGAVLGPGVPGVADGGPTGDADPGEPTPGAGDATTRTADGGSGPTGSGVTDPSTVPGVSEAGLENASRLGQAHATAVARLDSYTVWFDYYRPENGSGGQVQYDADVAVEGERASVVTSLERPSGDRSVVSAVYFDGTNRYVARNGSDDFRRVDDEAPTATPRAVPFTRPATMVGTYLATAESSVSRAGSDGDGERYRLHGTGRPAGLPETVEDYEMTALVDERGFVRSFEATFSIRWDSDGDGVGGRQRVRLTWSYDRLDATEVRFESAPGGRE